MDLFRFRLGGFPRRQGFCDNAGIRPSRARRICPIPSKAPPATILENFSEPCGKTPVLHGNEESEMSPSPYRPGEQPPPVPEPNRTPRPIEEPEPEDLPDEKRTPNPDEVREPPIHTTPSFG